MRPVVTCWPGEVHDVVGITGDPRMLILDGLTRLSVFECSSVVYGVSVRSGELRSGQLGPSEW